MNKKYLLAAVIALGPMAANAGVIATSFLSVSELELQIEPGNVGDGEGDPLLTITPLTTTRGESAKATFGMDSAGSDLGVADVPYACIGPDCASLTADQNDMEDLAGIQAAVDNSLSYAFADASLGDGSVLDGTGSGYTMAGASIKEMNSGGASGNSNINSNTLFVLELNLFEDASFSLAGAFDAFIDAAISADVAADSNFAATSTANADLTVTVTSQTGNFSASSSLSDLAGIVLTDTAVDFPGLGDLVARTYEDQTFELSPIALTADLYQVVISQSSFAQVSQVPAPATLALFSLGLLGLGAAARRKKA